MNNYLNYCIKHIVAAFLVVGLLLSSVSCSDKDNKTEGVNESDMVAQEISDADTMQNELDLSAVGGSYTVFEHYFDYPFDELEWITAEEAFVNTRKDEVREAISNFCRIQESEEYHKYDLAVLWYVVHQLGLTKEDIEVYNKYIDDVIKLTDKQIDILLIEDKNEANEKMRAPYTLYANGIIFTLEDIEKLTAEEFAAYGFSLESVETLMENLDKYPDTITKADVENVNIGRANARAFADEKIAKIKSLAVSNNNAVYASTPPGTGGVDIYVAVCQVQKTGKKAIIPRPLSRPF